MLSSLDPAVILVDNRMPEMEGLEVIERIRGMEKHEQTLVFLCTGAEPDVTTEHALEVLGSGYWPKDLLSGTALTNKLDEVLAVTTAQGRAQGIRE